MTVPDYRELMRNLQDARFVRWYPTFAHHTESKGGMLPNEKGAHAAWYYVICAHKSLEQVRLGAEYEGELDHVVMLNNIVRSIAAIYELDSPGELLKFIPHCRLEAVRCDISWDDRVENPYMVDYLGRAN